MSMGEIKILESLNYIDDIFISDAIFHKTVRRSDKLQKNKIVKIAVCLVFLSAILGCASFFNTQNHSLPFSLKVYGESEKGEVQAIDMEIDKKIPIDLFETKSGVKGFVFSYDKPDKNVPSAVAIVSEGDYDGIEEEILKMADDSTQNYIFYVPNEYDNTPIEQSFFVSGFEKDILYEIHLIINKEGDKYYVNLKR